MVIFQISETCDRIKPPPRSTQPSISPGSLNRVPASAGVKAGKAPAAGWQVTLCDPIWHVIFRSGEMITTNCYTRWLYFTLLVLVRLCSSSSNEERTLGSIARPEVTSLGEMWGGSSTSFGTSSLSVAGVLSTSWCTDFSAVTAHINGCHR